MSKIPVGLCQCGCGGRTTVALFNRSDRSWRRGEPKPFLPRHNLKSPLSERDRFFSYVYPDPNSGCHIWAGAESQGYGSFAVGSLTDATRRRIGAHLYAWLLAGNSQPPEGFELCHKCHIRCCVNPDHLYVGTRLENVDDTVRDLRTKAGKLPYGVSEQSNNPGTYMARLRFRGKRLHLGTYPSVELAAQVAEAKRLELRGAPRGR